MAVSAGAEDGVASLFRTHRLAMVRLALLLVDDRETAEDVAQEAFTALHRRWGALSSEDAAVAYLRTSVVNGSRSVLRRRRTARRHVRALPARQREVIVLRYWSELTEAQIAMTLGISVGAVKSSASRGRDAIAAQLEGRQR